MFNLREISVSLQSGGAQETANLIRRALRENYSAEQILKEGLAAGIAEAEQRYGTGVPFTPEMIFVARALNVGISTLRSAAGLAGGESWGTVIAGTVKEDLFDIEKNLSVMMMEIRGLRVIDLGVSVSAERFIESAKSTDSQIIACSAARINTMPRLKEIIHTAEAAGIRKRVKILISGKPVTEQYRAAIGADFFAPDALSAGELAAAHCRRILLPAA